MKKILFLNAIAILTFFSCEKDKIVVDKNIYNEGVLIINEGAFGTGTGTVDYIAKSSGEVKRNIFETVNARPLGNIAQSGFVDADKVYIVVNNAGKLEIVNKNDFQSVKTISNLELPDRVLVTDNFIYITEWVNFTGKGRIRIYNKTTYALEKQITLGLMPSAMERIGNDIWILNSNDNSVQVLDITTNTVTTTLSFSDNPTSLVKLVDGSMAVLSAGTPSWTGTPTKGSIYVINSASKSTIRSFSMPDSSIKPSNLVVLDNGKDVLYCYNGKTWKMDATTNGFPGTVFSNSEYYGLGFDTNTKLVFGSNAKDFSSKGTVYKYLQTGAFVDSLEGGVVPRTFLFTTK